MVNSSLVMSLRAGTFVLAIFAVLVGLQLYNLLKTGEYAKTWKSFIVGALVFAVWALADLADAMFANLFEDTSRIQLVVELLRLAFGLLFATGLWWQRQTFYRPDRLRPPEGGADGVESDVELDAEGDDAAVTVRDPGPPRELRPPDAEEPV